MPFTAISTNQHALRHARADISKETIMNAFIHYLIQTKQTNLIAVEKRGVLFLNEPFAQDIKMIFSPF